MVVQAVLKIWFPGIRAFTSVISITSLSCIGAAVCSICKVADEKEVIRKNIPWSLMLMIAGAVSLINVMNAAGLSDFLSGLFSESIPAGAYPIMFCLLGAAISFFVDTTGVVLPLFIPVAFVQNAPCHIGDVPVVSDLVRPSAAAL